MADDCHLLEWNTKRKGRGNAAFSGIKFMNLVAGGGFEPPSFGLCLPLQLSLLPLPEFGVWTFPSPYGATVRVLAVKSLHLSRNASGLGSGLPPPEASPTLASFAREFPHVQPTLRSSAKHHEIERIVVFADACRLRPCEFHCRSR